MSSPTPAPNGLATWLAERRAQSAAAIAVAGVAVLAVAVLLAAKYGTDYLSFVILSGGLGLLLLAAGVWHRMRQPEPGRAADEARYLALALGGTVGLFIAITGVALSYQWWDSLSDWLRLGKREGAWRVLLAVAVLLSGLAVMFVSLQSARAEVHNNPGLRRLVYGYNAVLTGLLLVMILAVVNVLVSLKFTGVIDATQSGQFTLSDRTVHFLKGLDKPVTMYLIWPNDDELKDTIQTLLGNFEDQSPNVKMEYVSPGLERQKFADLRKKFPRKIEEPQGVLIVQGDDKPENATFLKLTDLFAEEGFGQTSQVKFRGEDKILAALSAGAAGGKKTIVYFTQGAGEPDLNNTSPGQDALDKGIGVLRDRLTARGTFDVRPLRINPADPKVPDDANIVVVANPRPPVEAASVKALRQYLVERHGKAVFLFDVPADITALKALPATGLEPLLAEFNVEITNARILTERIQSVGGGRGIIQDPELATVEVADEARRSRNELAQAFGGEAFIFLDARVIRPLAQPMNPANQAEVLLTTRAGAPVWAETDLSADPMKLIEQMNRDEAERRKRLSPTPLPAAVTVTESAAPMGMPGQPPPAATPRLVVFGDTTFITNPLTNERSPAPATFAFFASTLDWLGERPTSIGIESRALPVFVLDPDVGSYYKRMIWLPLFVALVGITGLGVGVWMVRRR